MDHKFKISKPGQGVNTLVSELSLLRLEKTVKTVHDMRSRNIPEKDIREYIDHQHKDFDQRSRTQLYRISLGLNPKDDFTREELAHWNQLDETTLEITFKEPRGDFQECSLVFFESKRWAVVSRRESTLTLKSF